MEKPSAQLVILSTLASFLLPVGIDCGFFLPACDTVCGFFFPY
jgi:hypothetical protein